MRGILHDKVISERGTSTAVFEYAKALREHEGLEIALAIDQSQSHDQITINHWRSEFATIEYGNVQELEEGAKKFKADFLYATKSGRRDSTFIPDVRLLVHAVFREYDPHGHSYRYISDSLANQVRRDIPLRASFLLNRFLLSRTISPTHKFPDFPTPNVLNEFRAVPYVVRELRQKSNLRSTLGIPKDALVLGSLSATDSFNLQFVRIWVEKFLKQSNTHYFLCPNVPLFINHPRAIFLPRILGDEAKGDYLNSLDAMLHARKKGETFGLAMCEALKMGKPVFSWQGGEDQNHVEILRKTGWLYRNARDLDDLVEMLQDRRGTFGDQAASLVEEFTPKKVAEKFRLEFGV
jgi:hypothetical protein